MKYTREQAEQVFKDINKWVDNPMELYDLQKQFLDDKFPLPETGWVACNNGAIVYRTGERNGYGINSFGEWQIDCWSFISNSKSWRTATREEVEDALINFARKQGYKNGNYKCLGSLYTHEVNEDSFYVCPNNFVWHGCKSDLYNLVFKSNTGEWAKIIEDENKELKEQIEKVEKQLNELKARL